MIDVNVFYWVQITCSTYLSSAQMSKHYPLVITVDPVRISRVDRNRSECSVVYKRRSCVHWFRIRRNLPHLLNRPFHRHSIMSIYDGFKAALHARKTYTSTTRRAGSVVVLFTFAFSWCCWYHWNRDFSLQSSIRCVKVDANGTLFQYQSKTWRLPISSNTTIIVSRESGIADLYSNMQLSK